MKTLVEYVRIITTFQANKSCGLSSKLVSIYLNGTFDGSSTNQAAGEDSEVLNPALFNDPFRRGHHKWFYVTHRPDGIQ